MTAGEKLKLRMSYPVHYQSHLSDKFAWVPLLNSHQDRENKAVSIKEEFIKLAGENQNFGGCWLTFNIVKTNQLVSNKGRLGKGKVGKVSNYFTFSQQYIIKRENLSRCCHCGNKMRDKIWSKVRKGKSREEMKKGVSTPKSHTLSRSPRSPAPSPASAAGSQQH